MLEKQKLALNKDKKKLVKPKMPSNVNFVNR
jgi:hypothetical protein